MISKQFSGKATEYSKEPMATDIVQRYIVMLSLSIEKGKPTERWGRKATGLRGHPMTAGLPESVDRRRNAAIRRLIATAPVSVPAPMLSTRAAQSDFIDARP